MTYAEWHISLSRGDITLRQRLENLAGVGRMSSRGPVLLTLARYFL